MESKPATPKKRRVKKSKTFKKRFSNFFGNRHVENSWEINVLIFLLVIFAAAAVLFLAVSPSILEHPPAEKRVIFESKE